MVAQKLRRRMKGFCVKIPSSPYINISTYIRERPRPADKQPAYLEPLEAVDGVGAEVPLRLVVALVSPRPQPVEGEPGAPAVEGRVGQGGGRELDATQLVHVLQKNCVGCWGGRVGSQWS